MKTQAIFLFVLILLTAGLVSAFPGIPHQFYGSVYVNGEEAPDNNIIVAAVGGEYYTTITTNGKYGFSPNIFYVEDSDGDRAGETISFYLGGRVINGVYDFRGIPVGNEIFVNNGFTNLDISTTTTCEDGFCVGIETCSSCEIDCGVCMDPPIITINSPQEKTYDTLKIDLDVTADQDIVIWYYYLNGQGPILFTPNIILTAQEGENTLSITGIGKGNNLGTRSLSFTVDVPICGDLNCEAGEDCSTCPTDCGVCIPSGGSGGGGSGGGGSSGGGGGGSSGGGGGGGSAITLSDTSSSSNSGSGSGDEENPDEELLDETQKETNVGGSITGGIVGFMKSGTGMGLSIAIVLILAGIGVMVFRDKKKPSK